MAEHTLSAYDHARKVLKEDKIKTDQSTTKLDLMASLLKSKEPKYKALGQAIKDEIDAKAKVKADKAAARKAAAAEKAAAEKAAKAEKEAKAKATAKAAADKAKADAAAKKAKVPAKSAVAPTTA